MPAQEGNVVIQAGECVVTAMPALGGKISSIRVADHELLQAPLTPYAPRSKEMDFSESDASGWDECLPSVAACRVETPAGMAEVPDHGDLWRIPWQLLESTGDSMTMRAKCFSLPLQLTRSMLLNESPAGWSIELLYSLTNLGAYEVPWSWSAHPLFAVDAGDRITLPAEIKSLRVEGSSGNRLTGLADWPISHIAPAGETDLSFTQGVDVETGDKLFAGPFLAADQAWCFLERTKAGLRLSVRFDPLLTPYLGLWLCYGGWPNIPGPKQVCVALEPCTAPVDSLAIQGEWSRFLEPGETFNWMMSLGIEQI